MTKSAPTVVVLAATVWAATATAQGLVRVQEIAWTNLGLESPLQRPPRWSGGSFLTYDTSTPGLVALVAYGRDGTPFPRVNFTIPGATVIRAYSAARSPDGTFAVSGSAFTASGQGAMFLAWISADGAEQRLIRTNPFAIDNLTFGPDGAVWAVGQEIENGAVPAEYFVVRRFDPSGKSQGYFPRSQFKVEATTRGGIEVDPRVYYPALYSRLAASSSRIGWYSQVTGEYLEWSPKGELLMRVPGPALWNRDLVTASALCDDDSSYLEVLRIDKHPMRRDLLRLDRNDRSWRLVAQSGVGQQETLGALYGCDGDLLVMMASGPKLRWIEVADDSPLAQAQSRH